MPAPQGALATGATVEFPAPARNEEEEGTQLEFFPRPPELIDLRSEEYLPEELLGMYFVG